jgi:hypothetical protein
VKSGICWVVSALCAAASKPALAQEGLPTYRASGSWSLDYGVAGCSASRSFTAGTSELRVSFTQSYAPMVVNVEIAGGGRLGDATQLRLVSGSEAAETARFQRLPAQSESEPTAAGFFLSVETLRSSDQPVELLFQRGERQLGKAMLADFRSLIAALRTCQDDLYRGAGIDPAPLRRIAVDASPGSNEARWVTTDDLPEQFRGLARPLTVQTRLTINAEGRVSGCTIATSSGEPLLDLQSCRLLTARARYHPARDAAGQAVPTIASKRVRWLGVHAH